MSPLCPRSFSITAFLQACRIELLAFCCIRPHRRRSVHGVGRHDAMNFHDGHGQAQWEETMVSTSVLRAICSSMIETRMFVMEQQHAALKLKSEKSICSNTRLIMREDDLPCPLVHRGSAYLAAARPTRRSKAQLSVIASSNPCHMQRSKDAGIDSTRCLLYNGECCIRAHSVGFLDGQGADQCRPCRALTVSSICSRWKIPS